MAARRGSTGSALVGALVALVAGFLLYTQGDGGTTTHEDHTRGSSSSPSSSPTHDLRSTTTPTTDPTSDPATDYTTDPDSGLPVVRSADLPGLARDVLQRIDRGGPFDFPDHDGGVFENREGLLPDRPRGYYREYTVDDGVGDRGPLRIVAGDDGERYWTDDHYRSFARIGD